MMLQKNTPGELSDTVTEKDFKTSCRKLEKRFGKINDFKFLTALDTPAFHNLIWVVSFHRKGSKNQDICQQLLFRLVTMPDDEKNIVVSYGFI